MSLGVALIIEESVYLYEVGRIDGEIVAIPVPTDFDAARAAAACRAQYARTERERERRRLYWHRQKGRR